MLFYNNLFIFYYVNFIMSNLLFDTYINEVLTGLSDRSPVLISNKLRSNKLIDIGNLRILHFIQN